VQHLGGVAQTGHVLGCQFAITELNDFAAHPFLPVDMVPESPKGIRQQCRRGVVAGQHEHDEFVADVLVGK
jgi:hypothetical protein